uniref:C6 domain-containing protein n=1 Tax=Parastrongyloides trichosuri TaxID=131310 RepID=A0A0N4ZPD2_PARTI
MDLFFAVIIILLCLSKKTFHCIANNGNESPNVKTTTAAPNLDSDTTTFIIDITTSTAITTSTTTSITTTQTPTTSTTTTQIPTTSTTTTQNPTSTTTAQQIPCTNAPLVITPAIDDTTTTPARDTGTFVNGVYKITVTCDVSANPNSLTFMQFNIDQGGPDENFLPTVIATLQCDEANNVWVYVSPTGVTRNVDEVNCLQM